MKIIVRQARDGWIWAFVAPNGKQTANNEVFATKANARRAAKAVVTSIVREYTRWRDPPILWTDHTRDKTFLSFQRGDLQ